MSSFTIFHSLWLPFPIFIALSAFILIVTKLIHRPKLPPGPPGIPIIGNLHQLGELPHRSLWKLSKRYGPLIHLKLGFVPTVVASSPEMAKEFLKTHDTECCSRPPLACFGKFSYDYSDLAFSPYSNYWREVRKLCVLELFSAKRVKSFGYTREEEVKSLIETLYQHSDSGESVDLSEKLMLNSANILCRIVFGMDISGSEMHHKRLHELLEEANEVLGRFSAADFFPYVGWIVDRFMGVYSKQEKCFRDLDEFYEETIRNHVENNKNHEGGEEDIVDVLLKLEREHVQVGDGEKGRFTKNHIKAILMNLVIGGVGTSPRTLIWTMTELIRRPKVMKKLQTEIRKHVKNKGIVKEEDLDKLEYLKLVIKETFRLHPPGPLLLPREAISKFQICGYDINPKTRIHVNIWAIGRDPTVWKDPQEFCPERFIGNTLDVKGQHFELLPFGGGRRICPGMTMASTLMELVLSNLLYMFDWKLPEGMTEDDVDMEEGYGISIQKKSPLQLVPVKYNFCN